MNQKKIIKHEHHTHYHHPPSPPGLYEEIVAGNVIIIGICTAAYLFFTTASRWFMYEFLPGLYDYVANFFLTLPQPYKFTLDFYVYTIGLPFKAAGYIWTKVFSEELTGLFLIDLPLAIIAIFYSFMFFMVVPHIVVALVQMKYKSFNMDALIGLMATPFFLCMMYGFFHLIYKVITYLF